MNKALSSLLFLLCSFIEVQVYADEAVVIEVKKNISMSKTDKIYRNYFINGGSNLGLKKGTVVNVVRRVAVHDPLKNASIGDIRVVVGKLEIIHAEPKISVAKLLSQESPEDRPVLDYEAIMVGDRLDLESLNTVVLSPMTASAFDPNLGAQNVALLDGDSKAQETLKGARGPASIASKAKPKSKANKAKKN